jgi:hypothetical protein
MLNRRAFLSSLLVTATLDPERLLWVPGKKLISIPNKIVTPPPFTQLTHSFSVILNSGKKQELKQEFIFKLTPKIVG